MNLKLFLLYVVMLPGSVWPINRVQAQQIKSSKEYTYSGGSKKKKLSTVSYYRPNGALYKRILHYRPIKGKPVPINIWEKDSLGRETTRKFNDQKEHVETEITYDSLGHKVQIVCTYDEQGLKYRELKVYNPLYASRSRIPPDAEYYNAMGLVPPKVYMPSKLLHVEAARKNNQVQVIRKEVNILYPDGPLKRQELYRPDASGDLELLFSHSFYRNGQHYKSFRKVGQEMVLIRHSAPSGDCIYQKTKGREFDKVRGQYVNLEINLRADTTAWGAPLKVYSETTYFKTVNFVDTLRSETEEYHFSYDEEGRLLSKSKKDGTGKLWPIFTISYEKNGIQWVKRYIEGSKYLKMVHGFNKDLQVIYAADYHLRKYRGRPENLLQKEVYTDWAHDAIKTQQTIAYSYRPKSQVPLEFLALQNGLYRDPDAFINELETYREPEHRKQLSQDEQERIENLLPYLDAYYAQGEVAFLAKNAYEVNKRIFLLQMKGDTALSTEHWYGAEGPVFVARKKELRTQVSGNDINAFLPLYQLSKTDSFYHENSYTYNEQLYCTRHQYRRDKDSTNLELERQEDFVFGPVRESLERREPKYTDMDPLKALYEADTTAPLPGRPIQEAWRFPMVHRSVMEKRGNDLILVERVKRRTLDRGYEWEMEVYDEEIADVKIYYGEYIDTLQNLEKGVSIGYTVRKSYYYALWAHWLYLGKEIELVYSNDGKLLSDTELLYERFPLDDVRIKTVYEYRYNAHGDCVQMKRFNDGILQRGRIWKYKYYKPE